MFARFHVVNVSFIYFLLKFFLLPFVTPVHYFSNGILYVICLSQSIFSATCRIFHLPDCSYYSSHRFTSIVINVSCGAAWVCRLDGLILLCRSRSCEVTTCYTFIACCVWDSLLPLPKTPDRMAERHWQRGVNEKHIRNVIKKRMRTLNTKTQSMKRTHRM